VHAVVTVNEINDLHGTGPLVKRIFKDRCGIFSIRSRDHWGAQGFWRLAREDLQQGRTRSECFPESPARSGGQECEKRDLRALPSEELLTSIAIKESFDAQMCV